MTPDLDKVNPQDDNQSETRSEFEPPELITLGDARILTGGSPNGRWQDGSFNPTRFKS
jgi:hypothetical protein